MRKSILSELCWFQPISEGESYSHEMCKDDQTKESIWHRRYGHLGARNLERIAKEQMVDGSDYEPKKESSFCEPCVYGKRSTLPFPKTGGERSDELLGIVHSDVCGKTKTKLLSGAEYFTTFIDDVKDVAEN